MGMAIKAKGDGTNFYERPVGPRQTSLGAAKRAGAGAVFCRSFQSDFTNEMGIWCSPGRVGSNGIHAYASWPAILGGLTLVIDHFISEITDCTQRQKTAPTPTLFPAPRLVCLGPTGRS